MTPHRRTVRQLAVAILAAVALIVALAPLTPAPRSGHYPPSAQASGYCSATCAIRKANARIRGSYECTHLNYVCHVNVGVALVDWTNGNWGWSGNVGRRCRRIVTQDFSCRAVTSGGQIRKRDGAWRGFWWKIAP